MKFLALTLIALACISSVAADSKIEAALQTCAEKGKVDQPCASGSQDCQESMVGLVLCMAANKCDSDGDFSAYAKCIKPCKSDNAEAQKLIDQMVACLSSQYLAVSSLIAALLVFLF